MPYGLMDNLTACRLSSAHPWRPAGRRGRRLRRLTRACLVVATATGLWLHAEDQDSVPLRTYDFEDGAIPWVGGETVASISAEAPASGTACLFLDLTKAVGQGVEIRTAQALAVPASDTPRARLVRVTLAIRTRDVNADGIRVRVLSLQPPPRWNEWLPQDPLTGTENLFAVLPVKAGPEWTRAVHCEFVAAPDVRNLVVYLQVSNRTGKEQVWVDDLTVDLLDRGLLRLEENQGNVFPGETSALRFLGRDIVYRDEKVGTVYAGERATLRLAVSAAQRVREGSVRLYDEEERLLSAVPVQPGAADVAVELPTRGYYAVRAEITYQDGTRCGVRTTAAVLGDLIPTELRMASPFGLHGLGDDLGVLAGARWDRTFWSMQHYKDYQDAAAAGFPPDRQPAKLHTVPKARTLVYCLCEQPPWLSDTQWRPLAATQSGCCPPKDWNQFRQFIRYIVKSLDGKVDYIEAANEPDDWHGPWEDLVRYHQEMAAAIREVSPGTKLLGPAFCQIDLAKVKKVVDLGLLDYVDALSIHAYVSATPPEDEFIGKVRELKAYLASVGRKDTRIILSEYGWTLPPGDWQKPVDPLTQARYVSRSSILLTAEQIDGFIYFLTRAGAGPTTSAAGYGLLNWDFSPRPGYAAYGNVARLLTGVGGPGRCFQMTPTTWLVLFSKNGRTLAAAWDVKGPGVAFVPQPWVLARDMTGRPLTPPATSSVSVTPSPVFIDCADAGFYQLTTVQNVSIRNGAGIKLPWEAVWTPPGIDAQGDGLTVQSTAPKGRYLVIGRNAGRWEAVEIVVTPPVAIESAELVWPVAAPQPALRTRTRSYLANPITVNEIVKLAGAPDSVATGVPLPAGATADAVLPLPALEPGKRYTGTVVVAADGEETRSADPFRLDVTLLPCLALASATANAPAWDTVPALDFSTWAPFGSDLGVVAPFAPENCSATLQTGYDALGLHVRVVVRDDAHLQVGSPKEMWKQDSIQIALDLDAELPWRANAGGCNGHVRVFEYGFALGEPGPMTWRWLSYHPELPPDTAERQLQMKVLRESDKTLYEIVFPWTTLRMTAAPAPGSKIGVALAVNDADPGAGRHGLRLLNGIVDKKDPAAYGLLWIR
jgi:hypothetical protein